MWSAIWHYAHKRREHTHRRLASFNQNIYSLNNSLDKNKNKRMLTSMFSRIFQVNFLIILIKWVSCSAHQIDLQLAQANASINLLLVDGGNEPILTASLGNSLNYFNLSRNKTLFKSETFQLTLETTSLDDDEIQCTTFNWRLTKQGLSSRQQFEDCFNLDTSYWYGGPELYSQQYWPINKQVWKFISTKNV